MKIKINKKFNVDPFNIVKVVSKNNQLWLYMESGYPKIIKCKDSKNIFRLRLANSGLNRKQLEDIFDAN